MSLAPIRRIPNQPRLFSTLSKISQKVAAEKEKAKDEIPKDIKFTKFTPKQQAFLDKLIRVDQAGELGANYIYQGQIYALVQRNPHLRPVLNHMWEQEVHHHNTFNELQSKHRVRPSLLTPVWKAGAIAMGYVTGSISKEAAMACTVAVETVIGGHYNEQLRVLMNEFNDVELKELLDILGSSIENKTGAVSDEIQNLKSIVKEFRDQELEHLDTAIEHDAESAVPYQVITGIIKGICKLSIWTAERV